MVFVTADYAVAMLLHRYPKHGTIVSSTVDLCMECMMAVAWRSSKHVFRNADGAHGWDSPIEQHQKRPRRNSK